ncbi:MAG: bacteriorhodopsin, partial [Herbiconiux sp.]|nr:bacteriorhodopsin [Herbiconiux sp.]
GMLAVALLSSSLILVAFLASYRETAGGWAPTSGAVDVFGARYAGWTVSVPLLTVELLAVCAVAGRGARRARATAVLCSGAMILCGFLGGVVIQGGRGPLALVLGAVVGTGFLVATVVVLRGAVRQSAAELTPESQALLRQAAVALLVGWCVYPIVYLLPLLGGGGALTTGILLALTVTDVTVKLVFSARIHRVAQLRTAEDVRAGVDVHPESIWISSVKQSDAGLPREVYLANGAAVHARRPKPPIGSATPSADPEVDAEFEVAEP